MNADKQIIVKDKIKDRRHIKIVEFDRSKNITQPHRHNGYLELVFLSSTSGIHVIDGRESTVKPPCLLVIRKDNVHHWELVNPVKGFVILIKDSFVMQSADFEINRLVGIISQYDTLYFKQGAIFETLLRILVNEGNKTCQEGLFKAFLAKVLEHVDSSNEAKATTKNIYDRFYALLNSEAKVINHVAYYAVKLNTSPQNLNAVCKKNANRTASALLAEYIIKEAKRLLFYTTCSISEVAFELGFSDKSNFAKYFKRHTGTTPTAFKKQNY
ncbi:MULTISPECIES: helix-turn-helix domain-containing protein [Sphingobacterium]|uniref:helix-turn-helix domain-containing protein n=1 Tax=Sphingobacterium TaxID=28453 RepID=UPI0013DB152F|nr:MULTISPECIES: helix-turn-helix transcriptional regulator [unclassified Sphingobacterium]